MSSIQISSAGWTMARSLVALSGNANNQSPGNLTHLLLQGNGFQVTGFSGGEMNRVLMITEGSNAGSTLVHNSGSSSAANRMILSLAGNVNIPLWHTVVLIYNATDSLWYQLGQVTILI